MPVTPITPAQTDALAALARFGHHPDPSTDFCIEIDDLTGYAYDVRVGMNFVVRDRSQWPFWGRLSRALRFAREQTECLDDIARAAIPTLRKLEGYARRSDSALITAPLHEIGGSHV